MIWLLIPALVIAVLAWWAGWSACRTTHDGWCRRTIDLQIDGQTIARLDVAGSKVVAIHDSYPVTLDDLGGL